MSDPDLDIHSRVTALVSREHQLRGHVDGSGPDGAREQRDELASDEVEGYQ